MLEMVTEAKTLREIQLSGGGVTGSFRDTPVSDWLEKHNPSQLEFGRAVMNFTRESERLMFCLVCTDRFVSKRYILPY
jgi:hypothetical protein